jgi:type IV secretory pathway VirB2 component (pilin)
MRVIQSKAAERTTRRSAFIADVICTVYNRFISLIIIGLIVLNSGSASAGGYGGGGGGPVGTPMADVLCLIVNWFSGNLGHGLATIGISAVAVGAIFGKVSWGLALTVMVGVAVMYGASDILVQLNIISAGVC